MRALDANALVRDIAQDDPSQSAPATRPVEEEIGPAEPAFVSLVALLETVWVLESVYAAKLSLVCMTRRSCPWSPSGAPRSLPSTRRPRDGWGCGC